MCLSLLSTPVTGETAFLMRLSWFACLLLTNWVSQVC